MHPYTLAFSSYVAQGTGIKKCTVTVTSNVTIIMIVTLRSHNNNRNSPTCMHRVHIMHACRIRTQRITL